LRAQNQLQSSLCSCNDDDDSIKHFTGFDISGKSEAEYLMLQEAWELMWMLQWVREID
jgi:hypothetical protein